ncbi:hypothetical protein VaNZ11_009328, partial [Volvox africanus]
MARISSNPEHGYDVRPIPTQSHTPETAALAAMQVPLQIARSASPTPPEVHCYDWRSASTLTATTRRRQSGLNSQAYRAASNTAGAAATAALKDGDCSSTSDIGCESWVQRAACLSSDQAQGAKACLDRAHLHHLMHKNAGLSAIVAATIGAVQTHTPEPEPEGAKPPVVPSFLYGNGYNSSLAIAAAQAAPAPPCEAELPNLAITHQHAACSSGVTVTGGGADAGPLTGAAAPDAQLQLQSIRLTGAVAACGACQASGDVPFCNSPCAGINAIVTTPSTTVTAAVSSNSPHTADGYCDSEGPRYGGRSSTIQRTNAVSGGAGFSRPGITKTTSTASAPLRPTARPLTRVSISPLVIPGGSPTSSPRATPLSGSRLGSSVSVGLGTPTTPPGLSVRDVRKAPSCAVNGPSGALLVNLHRGVAADRFTRPDHAGLMPTSLEPSPASAGSLPSPFYQLQLQPRVTSQQQQMQQQQPDASERRLNSPCGRNSPPMPAPLVELSNRRVLLHPGERGKQQPSSSLQQLQPQQLSKQQQHQSLGFVDEIPPRLVSSRRSYAGGGTTATGAVVRPGSSSRRSPYAYISTTTSEDDCQDRAISSYADVKHSIEICSETCEAAPVLGWPCGRQDSQLGPSWIPDGASVIPTGSGGAASHLSAPLPIKSSPHPLALPTPSAVAATPPSITSPGGAAAADRRQWLLATSASSTWGPAATSNESGPLDPEIGVGATITSTTQRSPGELRAVAATVHSPPQQGPQHHAFSS